MNKLARTDSPREVRNSEPRAFRSQATVRSIEVGAQSSRMRAWVIVPPKPSLFLDPMVAVHGIGRDAHEIVRQFAPEAVKTGRLIIVPQFDASQWPVFQRITDRHRPDLALLAVLSALEADGSLRSMRTELFGFSGGAQFAHRFAMLYPQLVSGLHLGAAGWYCRPDFAHPYPYGLADDEKAASRWGERMAVGLASYLRLKLRIYVGTEDIADDAQLRRSAALDVIQGSNRLDRARSYLAAFKAAATARGISPDAKLRELPGCGHDFGQCARFGALARRVAAPIQTNITSKGIN